MHPPDRLPRPAAIVSLSMAELCGMVCIPRKWYLSTKGVWKSERKGKNQVRLYYLYWEVAFYKVLMQQGISNNLCCVFWWRSLVGVGMPNLQPYHKTAPEFFQSSGENPHLKPKMRGDENKNLSTWFCEGESQCANDWWQRKWMGCAEQHWEMSEPQPGVILWAVQHLFSKPSSRFSGSELCKMPYFKLK